MAGTDLRAVRVREMRMIQRMFSVLVIRSFSMHSSPMLMDRPEAEFLPCRLRGISVFILPS